MFLMIQMFTFPEENGSNAINHLTLGPGKPVPSGPGSPVRPGRPGGPYRSHEQHIYSVL